MNVIMIEDETLNRELLHLMLAEHCPSLKVVGWAPNRNEGVRLVKSLKPDLVFLDIRMSGTDEGLTFFSAFPSGQLPFDVVFVSAHEEYVLRAFNSTPAIGYLLKPVDPSELIQLMFKARQRYMARLQEEMPIDEGRRPTEVMYCYIKDNTVRMKLTDGKEKIAQQQILENYESHPSFLRINRQFVVNMDYINKITDIDDEGARIRGGFVLLFNGEKIPVSVARKSSVWKAYKEN